MTKRYNYINNMLGYLETVIDIKQEKKVKHLMKDIILIVFFAKPASANEWMEICYFAIL